MSRRTVLISCAVFCLGFWGAIGLVTIAHAEPISSPTGNPRFKWDPTTGEHFMYDRPAGLPEAKLERTWTAGEWEAGKQVDETMSECLATTRRLCEETLKGVSSPLKGGTAGELQAGKDVVAAERGAGASLPADVAAPVDALAEGGKLTAIRAGAAVLGKVSLGVSAFMLGVDIGNGIDQLFGMPELNLSLLEGELKSGGGTESCSVTHISSPTTKDYTAYNGGVVPIEPGYYLDCSGWTNPVAERQYITTRTGEPESSCYFRGEGKEGAAHGAQHVMVVELVYDEYWSEKCTQHKQVKLVFEWATPDCEPANPSQEWLENEGKIGSHAGPECVPVGVPDAGLLSPGQESVNEAHGKPARPTAPPPVLPKAPTITKIPNKTIENFYTHIKANEYIHEHQHKTDAELAKEKEEEEKKLIPIPGQEQLAVEYKDQMLGEGFTNVVVVVVAESAINPSVGPNDVAAVHPAPGLSVTADTAVEVDANPANSPSPVEPTEGMGGPTPPGIKVPSFGVLCEGFPFGVPCWLIQAIEKWSASATAPVWGIEEMTIMGHKIPGGTFDLKKLEPIMSPVRTAMVFFCTFGIVLLFYRFAMGGGPPSGTGGGGDTGSYSNMSDPSAFGDEGI